MHKAGMYLSIIRSDTIKSCVTYKDAGTFTEEYTGNHPSSKRQILIKLLILCSLLADYVWNCCVFAPSVSYLQKDVETQTNYSHHTCPRYLGKKFQLLHKHFSHFVWSGLGWVFILSGTLLTRKSYPPFGLGLAHHLKCFINTFHSTIS